MDGDGKHPLPASRGVAVAMLVLTAITVLGALVAVWLALT